jgi:hypothetical protein
MPRMHKYGESETTRIMMATVRHVTSSSGLGKLQAAWFLLNRGYMLWLLNWPHVNMLRNGVSKTVLRITTQWWFPSQYLEFKCDTVLRSYILLNWTERDSHRLLRHFALRQPWFMPIVGCNPWRQTKPNPTRPSSSQSLYWVRYLGS